ncbi:MAG: glycosyltransferase family 4 protein [Candidatus Microgenomates bacterium]
MLTNKKIAIVYDWFDKWGGVERILLILKKIFPQAVFFTSYFDKKKASWANKFNIKTSFLQNFPNFLRTSRILSIPFYPFVFETFDFSKYDLVISITSSFAKSVITHPKTKHICYLLTPTRFLWSHEKDYFKNKNFFINNYLNYLKKWDLIVSKRPDKMISISKTVQKRCQKYYKIKSDLIYPPFDDEYWAKIKLKIKKQKLKIKIKDKNFFLIVSRLEPYKKIDFVIKAFNNLNENLVIIGDGSQEKKLKKIANKNIIFFSRLTDEELAYFYLNAKTLIMPQNEDFGYVSLESQFFNCPVIAYKQGGALETVIENKTGIFFEKQNETSLIKTIERFNEIKYNLKKTISIYSSKNLERFSKEKFIKNLLKII